MLIDIPNKQLYDCRTSVYDLARQTVERHLRSRPGTLPLLIVISDGRANVPLVAAQRDCLAEIGA